MSPTQPAPAPREERLSWTEIRARYPDQWVAVAETEWAADGSFDFTSALVLGAAPSRREGYERCGTLMRRYGQSGVFFTGERRAPLPWILYR